MRHDKNRDNINAVQHNISVISEAYRLLSDDSESLRQYCVALTLPLLQRQQPAEQEQPTLRSA